MTTSDKRIAFTGGTPARKPRIALMGEFSSGKSTLTNLLLGADPLPVQVTATQLPPVWISYGDQPCTYEDIEGETHPVDIDALDHVPLEKTRHIRLYLKAEILALCDLIDMPGISDPNMSSDVWMRVIDDADSVLWCTPATQSWRQSEAGVWKMLPSELYCNSLLLLTRFDKITTEEDREKVLKRVRREAKDLFSDIFPVSLTQALSAREDQEVWDKSGADPLVRRFVDLLIDLQDAIQNQTPQQPIESTGETEDYPVRDSSETEPEVPEIEACPDIVRPARVIAKPNVGRKSQRPPRRPSAMAHQEEFMRTVQEA